MQFSQLFPSPSRSSYTLGDSKRADERTRTADLLIANLLECDLARTGNPGNCASLGGFRRTGANLVSVAYQLVSARLQYAFAHLVRHHAPTATLMPGQELGRVLVGTRDRQRDKPSPGTLDSGAAARQKAFFRLSQCSPIPPSFFPLQSLSAAAPQRAVSDSPLLPSEDPRCPTRGIWVW